MITDDILLSVELNESGEKVTRHVKQIALSRENLQKIWLKSKKFPMLFDTEVLGDFEKFCSIFLELGEDGKPAARGLIYVIDDFLGIFYLTNIEFYAEENMNDADCHFTFFDGRIHGRDVLARAMVNYVFEKYAPHRLSAKLPIFVKAATKDFIKRIGFKLEGTLKSKCWRDNQHHDVLQLAILHSEWNKTWAADRRQSAEVVEHVS